MDPRDLPEIKRDVLQHMYDHGPALMTIMPGDRGRSVAMFGESLSNPAEAEEILFGCQLWALDDTSTFYVTREMTEKVLEASHSMPDWIPEPEDAPADRGMIYFEGLEELRGFTKATAAWTWSFQDVNLLGFRGSALVAGAYTDLRAPTKGRFKKTMEDGMRSAGMPLPRLAYTGPDVIAGITGEERRIDSMAILKAAWLIMRQEEFADASSVDPSRNSAKRIKRLGGNPSPVRVVDLRRKVPSFGSSGGPGSRQEYRCKVRGHWRNQWYPSRGVHRPKWIEEHVRGPEDAPIIERDTVYRLR